MSNLSKIEELVAKAIEDAARTGDAKGVASQAAKKILDLAAPTVLVVVEDGMAETVVSDGRINLIKVDMDRDESTTEADIESDLAPSLTEGSPEELAKRIAETRQGLERYLDDDAPTP